MVDDSRSAPAQTAIARDEMAARTRALDWAATPLGPAAAWPTALAHTVALILAARIPMGLRWGRDLVLIYNDAFAPLLNDRHPDAFGQSFAAACPGLQAAFDGAEQAVLAGDSDGYSAENRAFPGRPGAAAPPAQFKVDLSPIPDAAV